MPRLNVRLLRILRPHVSTNDLVAMFYIDSSFRWCCVSLVQRSTRQKLGNFVGVEREFPKFCNTIWIQLHDFSDRVRKNIHLHEYSQSSDKLTITGQVKFYAYKFYKSQISSLCYLLWNCKIVKVNYATKTCNLKRPTCHNIRYSSWNCETVKLVFLQFLFLVYIIITVWETKRRRMVETIDFSKVSETFEAKNETRTFPELFRRDLFAVDVHLSTSLPRTIIRALEFHRYHFPGVLWFFHVPDRYFS